MAPVAMAADENIRHPFLARQPASTPEAVLMVVEIPAGGSIKYEIDEDGLIRVDRFLSMPMAYPANYGSISRSLAGDGDPLDALVLTRTPLQPGTLVEFRPIGYLRMRDRGDGDEKVIGVPTERVDSTYSGVRDLADLPLAERQRIEAFFRVYKELADGGNPVVLDGFAGAAEARELVERSLQRFERGAGD